MLEIGRDFVLVPCFGPKSMSESWPLRTFFTIPLDTVHFVTTVARGMWLGTFLCHQLNPSNTPTHPCHIGCKWQEGLHITLGAPSNACKPIGSLVVFCFAKKHYQKLSGHQKLQLFQGHPLHAFLVLRQHFLPLRIMLAGAAVFHKTKHQTTVAGSSTEAEFMTESDCGRAILYLRSILDELGLPQEQPTSVWADNSAARQMMMAGRPTRRTRHIDIRYFAALHWVETDQLLFQEVSTHHNPSDSLTKQTGRIKFYEHSDFYMGRTPPKYIAGKKGTHVVHQVHVDYAFLQYLLWTSPIINSAN